MADQLASLSDINVHLPEDKLQVVEADLDELSREAARIIRGTLAGVYTPVELASWTDPDSTPELIRSIQGMLIAAFVYSRAYAEDQIEVPAYAQNKYDFAMRLLNGIVNGTESVLDVDGNAMVQQTHGLTDDSFTSSAEPKFRMDSVF